MPKLNLKIRHQLAQDEALKRIQGLLTEVKNEYADKVSDLQEEWNRNTCNFGFRAIGFSVSGTLTAEPDEIDISGDLPWAALPFKGKIESIIRERAEKMLA